MEQELIISIEKSRAKGACISRYVIRLKALETMREHCRLSATYLSSLHRLAFKLLKRNKWVLINKIKQLNCI